MERNHGFERFSLANDLKKRVLKDFPLIRTSQLWGNEKETPTPYLRTDGSHYTGRDILIRVGSLFRSIDPLFWCKQFDDRIGDKIVCDDVRFLNEINYFKANHSPLLIRIERYQELCPHKRALDDYSEQDLDNFKSWTFRLEEEQNKTPKDLEMFASFINEHI